MTITPKRSLLTLTLRLQDLAIPVSWGKAVWRSRGSWDTVEGKVMEQLGDEFGYLHEGDVFALGEGGR